MLFHLQVIPKPYDFLLKNTNEKSGRIFWPLDQNFQFWVNSSFLIYYEIILPLYIMNVNIILEAKNKKNNRKSLKYQTVLFPFKIVHTCAVCNPHAAINGKIVRIRILGN